MTVKITFRRSGKRPIWRVIGFDRDRGERVLGLITRCVLSDGQSGYLARRLDTNSEAKGRTRRAAWSGVMP